MRPSNVCEQPHHWGYPVKEPHPNIQTVLTTNQMMKPLLLCLTLALPLAAQPLFGQASEIPSAGPAHPAGATEEQRGRKLLDQALEALGGDAWLNRHNLQVYGRIGRFFHGSPTGITSDFTSTRQFAGAGRVDAERIGFITDRSMILPGKKIDVVHIWTDGHGYEITYKGKTELPKDQVTDYFRRAAHSVESIYNVWLNAPGVVVLYEGTGMVGRRLSDKVTILSADNDAVTVELDATSHLPLRRSFQWRNQQFRDFDKDVEEYEDYHTVQGLPTAYSLTRYLNGDTVSQTFLTKIAYDVDLPPDFFNPEILVKKKK